MRKQGGTPRCQNGKRDTFFSHDNANSRKTARLLNPLVDRAIDRCVQALTDNFQRSLVQPCGLGKIYSRIENVRNRWESQSSTTFTARRPLERKRLYYSYL